MLNSTSWLSQLQFFLSLGFAAVFLVTQLGLSWALAYFKLRARNPGDVWTAAYRFWVRVFALAFILSFAAAIPVLIQFGSLWPALMSRIGEVAGPLLAGLVLTVFIFKCCFLGNMLFGQRRLSDRAHTVMVCLVAAGSTLAGLWLVILAAWVQSPTGAVLVDGQYRVQAWSEIVFNPFSGWLVGLSVSIAALAVGFLMIGVTARQSLTRPLDDSERLGFTTGLWLAMAGVALQLVVAPGLARSTAVYQPAKAAAVAGYWNSGSDPAVVLFGWPDKATHSNHLEVGLKGAGHWWVGKDKQGQLQGLDQFSGMAPPVALTFWSWRIVVLGGVFLGMVIGGVFWRLRARQGDPSALSVACRKLLGSLTFSGWVICTASLAYWFFGLHPFAVQGAVTVAEVAGTTSSHLLTSAMLVYGVVYLIVLLGFLQLLRHIARYGVVPVARRRGRA